MSHNSHAMGLTEVIGRALVDKDFFEMLFQNRELALRGFDLSDGDRKTLDRLDRATLEAHAEKVGNGPIRLMIVPEPAPAPPPPPPPPPPPKPPKPQTADKED